jgi:hypothetical protein
MPEKENKIKTSFEVAKINEGIETQQKAMMHAQSCAGRVRVPEWVSKHHIPFTSGHASVQGKRQNVSEPYR